MNKVDKNKPVTSIRHDDKRAAIPDSAHQGEEQMAISGMPEQSEYDIFHMNSSPIKLGQNRPKLTLD